MPLSVGIAGATTCLPDRRETARGSGIDEDDAEICDLEGYRRIPVCDGNPVTDLAVPAALDALRRSGHQPSDIDLVIYAWLDDQGDAMPIPHTRLARLIGCQDAVTIGIQQKSGGGAIALELAAELLNSGRYRTALVATGDVFDHDPHTRWVRHGSQGIMLGDGATAAVLDRRPRPLTVHAVASAGRPDTELQFSQPSATSGSEPVERVLNPAAVPAMRSAISTAVAEVLSATGLEPDDPGIRLVAFSRLGRTLLRRVYYPALPKGLPRPLELTSETGHLGAGDLLANLAHIQDNRLMSPGEYALLVNVGMGFNVTAVIVRADAADA
ncbi:ketoacyl-ACP synthase III family protein [Nocardia sp. NPDC019395]|uniref:ketoacyl-ACP synthase III family protein n=1 Tax=Nocardia sp. NPDC019395 TaxID=3154686 RepID=UPI0033D86FDE